MALTCIGVINEKITFNCLFFRTFYINSQNAGYCPFGTNVSSLRLKYILSLNRIYANEE